MHPRPFFAASGSARSAGASAPGTRLPGATPLRDPGRVPPMALARPAARARGPLADYLAALERTHEGVVAYLAVQTTSVIAPIAGLTPAQPSTAA